MRQTFVCTDGGRLRYSISGTGEPVVLLHGFGLDASMWDPQWPVLQGEFRAIRYDLRGFGGSSLPNGAYSHSEDLLGLLRLSRGGRRMSSACRWVGAWHCGFALDQPKAVKSLTLIDSALEGHSWSGAWNQKMGAIEAAAKRATSRPRSNCG